MTFVPTWMNSNCGYDILSTESLEFYMEKMKNSEDIQLILLSIYYYLLKFRYFIIKVAHSYEIQI